MEEITMEVEIGSVPDGKNIRFPILTTQKYVDRIIKNLRRRNITHMVRHSVGGYEYQITVNVGYVEICFWTIEQVTQNTLKLTQAA